MNFSKNRATIDLVLKSFIKSLKYLDLLTNSRELLLDESYVKVINNKDTINLVDCEEIYEEKLVLEEKQ